MEEKALDYILNGVAFATPATWVALYTAAPGETGGGTEVTGGAYARQRIFANLGGTPAWTLSAHDAGSGGRLCENSNLVSFPVATANWGTVTHTALLDASTAGNMLYYAALAASKVVNSGDQFTYPIGNLDVIER